MSAYTGFRDMQKVVEQSRRWGCTNGPEVRRGGSGVEIAGRNGPLPPDYAEWLAKAIASALGQLTEHARILAAHELERRRAVAIEEARYDRLDTERRLTYLVSGDWTWFQSLTLPT